MDLLAYKTDGPRLRRAGNARAFTLVEFLTAFVAMAVLGAILIPSVGKAKEYAKRVKCMANLHVMGRATQFYCTSYKFRFPDLVYVKKPGSSSNLVILVVPRKASCSGLNAYEPASLLCPNDPVPETIPVLQEDDTRIDMPSSYGYNIMLMAYKVKAINIPNPGRIAVFFDGSPLGSDKQGSLHGNGRLDGWLGLLTRHLGTGDVVFADGHVIHTDELTDEMVYTDPSQDPNANKGGGKK